MPYCLRVRLVAPLVAPLEARLERIMARQQLGKEAARRLIVQVDGERACYIKANYGKDWNLEEVYDLTLNTATLGYERVGETLVAALKDRDHLATPEARANLAGRALAYRLKARVATATRLLVPTLEVSFQEGIITVSGIIHTSKELHLIQEIAKEVCGDHPVRLDLHHRL